ncbi:TetR family transcriptional regulator [Actinomadura macra]|uniref:TetR family transcriptional regulator n=1 Tax=Actinomadura macra TaxID=46164 RepID=UPI0009FFA04B
MGRPRDRGRRTELLDQVIDYLAAHGLAGLSMRPLAGHLGQSTRVLTHHFADKAELVGAVLARLDELQRERLRALPGWDGERPMGEIVQAAWERQLAEENLPFTRLVHEIEGLAAGGRLAGQVTRLLADRVEFVAASFRTRGVTDPDARHYATVQNAVFAGLQLDVLNTGDRARADAGIAWLAATADGWVAAAHPRRPSPSRRPRRSTQVTAPGDSAAETGGDGGAERDGDGRMAPG